MLKEKLNETDEKIMMMRKKTMQKVALILLLLLNETKQLQRDESGHCNLPS